DFLQLEVVTSFAPPPAGVQYVVGEIFPGKLFPTYKWLVTKQDHGMVGQGKLLPDEQAVVTGHSLGGHLAALAVALFPETFSHAYAFNAPGYDSEYARFASGTDAILALFSQWSGVSPAPVASIGYQVTNIEAEDSIPGDDADVIAGLATGQPFSAEQYGTTERVTHNMGHLMDALAVQALMEKLNGSLELYSAGAIINAASIDPNSSLETIVEALRKIVRKESITLRTTGPQPEGIGVDTWVNGGDFAIREEFYQALIAIENAIESPRVSWRLFGLSSGSKLFFLGELLPVVCLGFGRRDIPDRSQEAVMVEPVHPLQRGQFHRLPGVPRSPTMNQFGFV